MTTPSANRESLRPCCSCGSPTRRRTGAAKYCWPCARAKDRMMARCIGIVQYSIMVGKMPKASALACVDCGAEAQEYDHRDYHYPLDVEPVCRSCNRTRGPAHPFCGALTRSQLRPDLWPA